MTQRLKAALQTYVAGLAIVLGLGAAAGGQANPPALRQTTPPHGKNVARRPAPSKTPPARPYDLAKVNNAATVDEMGEKSKGPAALRAQILLDRARFSVGEIDGSMGTNAMRAVAGFRASRGLPPGTSVDAAVWSALNKDTAPALVPYTLSAQDVEGPFTVVPKDMARKAKLKSLGYSSALEAVSEKFHVSPVLLRRLNPKATFRAAGQTIDVPGVRTPAAAKASRIVVSKSEGTLKVFNEMGEQLAQYPCTSGSEHDPLPIGEWKVTGVFKNPKFNYNPDLFWDADPKDTKATIPAGPNNPVGAVWIDLSKEHYGIHGTPAPELIGHAESHGCIRLTNWDALELAGMVEKGTPVSLAE